MLCGTRVTGVSADSLGGWWGRVVAVVGGVMRLCAGCSDGDGTLGFGGTKEVLQVRERRHLEEYGQAERREARLRSFARNFQRITAVALPSP